MVHGFEMEEEEIEEVTSRLLRKLEIKDMTYLGLRWDH